MTTKIQREIMKLAKKQGMSESEIQDLLKQMPINTSVKAKATIDPNTPVKATVGDYEGKPTITLQRGESSFVNRPFTFGKAKAQMIVAQYEAIKRFADSKE